jgi:hypothetical protein
MSTITIDQVSRAIGKSGAEMAEINLVARLTSITDAILLKKTPAISCACRTSSLNDRQIFLSRATEALSFRDSFLPLHERLARE